MRTKTRVIKTDKRLVMVGAKVAPQLHLKIKEYAQRHNMSIALVIENAIREYISSDAK